MNDGQVPRLGKFTKLLQNLLIPLYMFPYSVTMQLIMIVIFFIVGKMTTSFSFNFVLVFYKCCCKRKKHIMTDADKEVPLIGKQCYFENKAFFLQDECIAKITLLKFPLYERQMLLFIYDGNVCGSMMVWRCRRRLLVSER